MSALSAAVFPQNKVVKHGDKMIQLLHQAPVTSRINPKTVLIAMQQQCQEGTIRYARESQDTDAFLPNGEVNLQADTPKGEPVTFFHSKFVPKISLLQFAVALLRAGIHCDDQSVVVALVLMRRFSVSSGLPLTLHMMHRLFIACLLVGAKAHQDVFPCNMLVAKVSGIVCAELNRLETALLSGVNWNLLVRYCHIDDLAAEYSSTPAPESVSPTSDDDRPSRTPVAPVKRDQLNQSDYLATSTASAANPGTPPDRNERSRGTPSSV
jgi:hypothetical protein